MHSEQSLTGFEGGELGDSLAEAAEVNVMTAGWLCDLHDLIGMLPDRELALDDNKL